MLRQLNDFRLRTNFQIQVLSSLFFRNKGAYVVGEIVNDFNETAFALPIAHAGNAGLTIDAALFGEDATTSAIRATPFARRPASRAW